ncbi:MAG TPA: primosomal protein DnaI [Lactobacillaceae bacterium]|jgi:primosomal protein DnaI
MVNGRRTLYAMQSLAEALKAFIKENPRFAQTPDFDVEQLITSDEDVQNFWRDEGDQLAPDALSRSLSNLFEFIRQKRAIAEGRGLYPGYVPILQNQKGYVVVEYQPDAQTQLQQQQAQNLTTYHVAKATVKADLRAILKENAQDAGRGEALEAVWQIAKALPNASDYVRGLYLYGTFGVGKTYLLGALANELVAQNVRVFMLHVPTFATEIQRTIGRGDDALDNLLERAKTVPVLFLDDLGAENLSAWFRDNVLGMILEYRMQNELTTFISSNFDLASLETHLATTRDAVEPVKAARLMQRINFLTRPILLQGASRRLGGN